MGGALDVLVNNAGMGSFGNPLDGEPDEWDTMLMVNLHAPMRIMRRLVPAMVEKGQGVVINIGCSIPHHLPMTK